MIKVKQAQFKILPSANNRLKLHRAEAELKKWLKIEKDYWKEKAGLRWFAEGDKNFRFFHSYVNGRRKKLHITKINDRQGNTIHNNQQKRDETVDFL